MQKLCKCLFVGFPIFAIASTTKLVATIKCEACRCTYMYFSNTVQDEARDRPDLYEYMNTAGNLPVCS